MFPVETRTGKEQTMKDHNGDTICPHCQAHIEVYENWLRYQGEKWHEDCAEYDRKTSEHVDRLLAKYAE